MSSNTNFVQLKLAAAATAGATSLTVIVPTAPFQLPAANGTLTLLDVPAAPTKAEIVSYTTVTNNGDGTATLGGVTRGKEGTTAQAWPINSFLFQSLTAAEYAADLAGKEGSIAAGTTTQFWRGDKTWQDLGNTVRSLVLTGIVLTTNAAITASDTILTALGKLQKQITDLGSSKLDASSFTFANLGSKPTTLAGYGITDAAASGHTHNYWVPDTAIGGWYRSTGAVGWYSQTYGGGIYMTDTTYVRTYNGKQFACTDAIQIDGAAPQVRLNDTGWGVRYLYHDGGLIGFLSSGGNWTFYNDNAGNTTAIGNVTAYSDIRLKTGIEVIPAALAKVAALRGVTYRRVDSGERQTGVIAQEVQAVLPEAVMTSTDDQQTLSVAYGNLVGLLIEAIKELDAKVEALRNGTA